MTSGGIAIGVAHSIGWSPGGDRGVDVGFAVFDAKSVSCRVGFRVGGCQILIPDGQNAGRPIWAAEALVHDIDTGIDDTDNHAAAAIPWWASMHQVSADID